MGNLLKEIKETKDRIGGKPRQLDLVLKKLDSADRDDLLKALNDSNISCSVIARVLTKRGFPISRQMIQRFRAGSRDDA